MELIKYRLLLLLTAFMLMIVGCSSIGLFNIERPYSNTEISETMIPDQEEKMIFSSAADAVLIPDQIIYYHEGSKTVFNKDNSKFAPIVKMTKNRAASARDSIKAAILESELEEMKQKQNGLLEFVYANNVEAYWAPYPDKNIQIKLVYNSIWFPLSGEFRNYMIIWSFTGGPIGPLESPDEILTYLNQ